MTRMTRALSMVPGTVGGMNLISVQFWRTPANMVKLSRKTVLDLNRSDSLSHTRFLSILEASKKAKFFLRKCLHHSAQFRQNSNLFLYAIRRALNTPLQLDIANNRFQDQKHHR